METSKNVVLAPIKDKPVVAEQSRSHILETVLNDKT
jgi:hypothetical protein